MKLILKPGPKLVLKKWRDGKWHKTDVTDQWQRYLYFPPCKVKGVALRDILLLLNSDIAFSKTVFHPNVDQIIEEGLRPGQTNLSYLELYQSPELHARDGLDDHPFPSLHTIGPDGDTEEQAWCVMYEPVNNLANLEIKMGDWAIYQSPEYGAPVCKAKKWPVSLGQIIMGLVWELSWFGTPKHRDEHAAGLDKIGEEICANLL